MAVWFSSTEAVLLKEECCCRKQKRGSLHILWCFIWSSHPVSSSCFIWHLVVVLWIGGNEGGMACLHLHVWNPTENHFSCFSPDRFLEVKFLFKEKPELCKLYPTFIFFFLFKNFSLCNSCNNFIAFSLGRLFVISLALATPNVEKMCECSAGGVWDVAYKYCTQ